MVVALCGLGGGRVISRDRVRSRDGPRGTVWIAFVSSAASLSTARSRSRAPRTRRLPLMIASLLTEDTLILDNVPRLADVGLLQRILGNHGVDIMVSGKRPGETADNGQTLHISAARIVDTTAPYELVSKMRASFWVIAPLVARMGQARVSHARRLRHRHAAGRSSHHGVGAARRRHRNRRRLCRRAGAARAQGRRDRLSQGHCRRHPYGADGGRARQRHDRDRECRTRAGDRRRRRLPQQDGRAHFRRRHRAHHRRGRHQTERRAPRRAARPHRDRHLCHGGRHGRRRRPVAERAAGIVAGRARRADGKPASRSRRPIKASASRATARACGRSR